MIKVLFLRSSFDPGGIETMLVELFNHDNDCFQTHLALLKDGSLIQALNPSKERLLFKLFRRRFFDLKVLVQLRKIVKVNDIQIVHTNQLIELIYAVALKMILAKLKIVHHIHTMFDRKGLQFYIERILCQWFTKIVTVSYSAKEELVQDFGFNEKKIKVIYNGISDQIDGNSKTVNSIPEQSLSMDHTRVNIIMVANFVWGKDHETVFQAYDRFIRDELPQVCFYFVGRETEISQKLVKKYLSEEDIENGRITLTGTIPDAKNLLPLFDIVLMSSFSETFNLSVVEGAMAGKPLITSDIAIFKELSENGKYFYLFRTRDPKNFYHQLESMIRNIDRIIVHPIYFQQKFSLTQMIDQFCNFYKLTLEASSHVH